MTPSEELSPEEASEAISPVRDRKEEAADLERRRLLRLVRERSLSRSHLTCLRDVEGQGSYSVEK